MPRMKILNLSDQEEFDSPPTLTSFQRKKYFNFPEAILSYAKKLKGSSQIGFLVNCAYFRTSGKFYLPEAFQNSDIDMASRILGTENTFSNYPKSTRRRHIKFILKFYGYKKFSESLIIDEIRSMISGQLKPKLIFWRSIDFLSQNKIELPSCFKLTEIITEELNEKQRQLEDIITSSLSPGETELLESLFIQSNNRYRLTLLKKISQSTRPTKIKEQVEDLTLLSSLHSRLYPVIEMTGLNREGIKYFAGSVLKSKIFQLKQRSDSSRYLHILAFISHQYYRLQDNLVDILLTVVKTFQNACQKQSKEQHYERRKVQADNVEKFISSVDGNLGLIKSIKDVTESSSSDAEKVFNIKELLARKDNHLEVEEAKVQLEDSFSSVDNEKIMESGAKRLQNRASQIIKILNFSSERGVKDLLEAIQCYKEKNGRVDENFPKDFLSEEQLLAINKSGEFSRPLYKVFLFCEIANSLKSGMLNLVSSYKYQPLDKYLISKDRWIKNKSELLRKANMQRFESPDKVLRFLQKDLATSYKHTNKRISSKKNPYFKKLEKGFRIATPAKDEEDHEPLQGYFPETQFIPLTEILFTVNESCSFMEEIGHWQQRRTKVASKKSIFASIMGLGCGIGTRKMAQISTSVSENEIEHAVNWYLSLDNLRSANDRIVRFMDTMELPNLYRQNKDKLHTASDGQKFTVRADSLNANYSFKYGGKEQVSTAYSFIDERNLLWYSLVFSAADRESAYVLDGLMHNDVVKSDIHSTDTHGYSEAIFGIAYILGFSYAPRIKNLKRQTLYTFRKIKKDPKWSVQASKYIDENLICKYWDDLLRLVCTIKLKETTASDIFRRLNSYSKQHELYKTIKAFGQIIKSDFILKYLDDLELRQAIEKQLNKVELANKFTRAVAIGSPREYKQGSKEEQEITESCNRLIKNAIICWNYMFLEKRLKKLPEGKQKETLLTAIKNHSPISWSHINLLGEYDFSENKMKDSQGILSTKKVIF